MRDHSFDAEEAALRPRSARIEDPVPDHVGRAAAQGRRDVLDGAALMGLQRAAGNGSVSRLMEEDRSPVYDVISSGGRPLNPEVRSDMEQRLGHDFGDVRVHDDGAAHESARAVNAHAYTVGSSVVFQRDKYDPSSQEGRVMLAHELTHVVQQRSGPVDGTSAPGGIRVSDPGDRFEREAAATAERAMSPSAETVAQAAQPGPAPQAVQRLDAPEEEQQEEPVQGAFVQRDAPAEEEEEAPE